MRKRILPALTAIVLLLIAWNITPVSGEKEFHGADSFFEKEGIVMLWAILKGSTEEDSWVYIKIIQTGQGPVSFQFFSVEAVDPFSNQKEWVVKGESLKKEKSVKSIRASFREKTARRVFFYAKGEDLFKENPAMVVYYLGVPDTAPEFMTEKEVEDYFRQALSRMKK